VTEPSGGAGSAGVSAAELRAVRRALELAATPGVPRGPNPRVGCVLLDSGGATVAEGWHRGAGTPHAEVDALTAAGERARGATAVVSLEPCDHTGRTGPCSAALIAAGVRRVVFAQSDPTPAARGGALRLRAAGVEVVGGVLAEEATAVNRTWTYAVTRGRPWVTWKVASTLDGRIAAADGTSRWITGPGARAQVHELRSVVDAVVIGTGTALADNPELSARTPSGELYPRQPLRVVVGSRELPVGARLFDGSPGVLRVAGTALPELLEALFTRHDVQHVLLEAGPTLSTAFLRAGLVQDVIWYVAPKILGAGAPVIADLGVGTLADAFGLRVTAVTQVGDDVRIDLALG
jgi:diaminohydroxyphosphoribosylaminopyrimidine deaminase / 5-amino-6-(5-phosphoribosylamino)uracil reductase